MTGIPQSGPWGSVSSLIKGRGGSWRMKVRTRPTPCGSSCAFGSTAGPPPLPPAPLPPTSSSLPSQRGAPARKAGAVLGRRSQLNSEVLMKAQGLALKPRKVLVTQSCLTLWDPMDCSPPGSSVHGDSPGKNTGVGCHILLQRIFPTQRMNPGLPHCRWILYHLSH